jgi:hypothetical protein
MQTLAQSSLISSVIHVLAMDLIAGAGITYYFDHPGGRDYDPDVYLHLSLVYKASERLTFDVSAFAAYQAQPDVTSALSANRRLGNFFRSEDNISAHYRWTPRFSTVTKLYFQRARVPKFYCLVRGSFRKPIGRAGSISLVSDNNRHCRYQLALPTTRRLEIIPLIKS